MLQDITGKPSGGSSSAAHAAITAMLAFAWHRKVLLGSYAVNFIHGPKGYPAEQGKVIKKAFQSFFMKSFLMIILIGIFTIPAIVAFFMVPSIYTQIAIGAVTLYFALYFLAPVALMFPSIALGNIFITIGEAYRLAGPDKNRIVFAYFLTFLSYFSIAIAVTFISIFIPSEMTSMQYLIPVNLIYAAVSTFGAMLWAGLNSALYKSIAHEVRDYTADTDSAA